MSKHTPGPWTFRQAGANWRVYASDGRSFDAGDALYHPENEANARLIAAAPELLRALEDLVDEQNGPPLIRYEKSWAAAMGKARSAIAKAEGK